MIDKINFNKLGGLVPAVVQDAETGQVLMVGFMNREALEITLREKKVTFWSRSKNKIWQKGETSGNVLDVISVQADCDNDSLLIKAKPAGPVCHTGKHTCFDEDAATDNIPVLLKLESIIGKRKAEMPEDSYTANLFRQGLSHIAQKVGEEAVETLVAALGQNHKRICEESADLLYHLLVLLAAKKVTLDEVLEELKERM